MNIQAIRISLILFFLFTISSCVRHRQLLNIQNSNKVSSPDTLNLTSNKIPYKIQPGDILDIKISSIDPQSVAIFNKDIAISSNQVNPATIYLNGYSVSDSGFIKIPIVGFIKVEDLELLQVESLLEDSLYSYFKNLSVDVKLMSFRISFIGEVINQGTFTVYNNDINILQGIGLAGGVTDLADRTKIRIIRKEKEKSKLYYVNLLSTDIINSDVYYLKPNDVIYIEPLKAKTVRVNSTTITAALSILTFMIVLINFASK